MKNTIIFQDSVYTILDVSTDLHKEAFLLIDTYNASKVEDKRIFVKTQDAHHLCAAFKKHGKTVYLSRFLMMADTTQVVDHINGNTLMCITKNMRLCTRAQNARNSHHTKLKGVQQQKSGRWTTVLCYNYKRVYLGTYDTIEEAALVYNKAAKLVFGEYASLNNL